MQLHDEIRWDAPPAEVAAMLADEAFVHALCARMHSDHHEVTVEGDATGAFTVVIARTVSTERFPELARGFVGRHVHVHQVDRWLRPDGDGHRNGTTSLSLRGLPVTLEGRYELRGWGTGSRITVAGQLRAAVPFFGGQLERMAAPTIHAALRRQQEAGQAWLAGER